MLLGDHLGVQIDQQSLPRFFLNENLWSNRLREKGLSKCRTGTQQGALNYENPELKSLWVQSTKE